MICFQSIPEKISFGSKCFVMRLQEYSRVSQFLTTHIYFSTYSLSVTFRSWEKQNWKWLAAIRLPYLCKNQNISSAINLLLNFWFYFVITDNLSSVLHSHSIVLYWPSVPVKHCIALKFTVCCDKLLEVFCSGQCSCHPCKSLCYLTFWSVAGLWLCL